MELLRIKYKDIKIPENNFEPKCTPAEIKNMLLRLSKKQIIEKFSN